MQNSAIAGCEYPATMKHALQERAIVLGAALQFVAPEPADGFRPRSVYIHRTHLLNDALGLISLDTAEAGMAIAVEVWYSRPGTVLLYGAFATHFMMALIAVYERRTFRLPPLELLRIVSALPCRSC